jgi:hypothetical protein
LGGYLASSAVASRAHLAIGFSVANPSLFPTGAWLGGVVSAAGGTAGGGVPNEWIYQNGVQLKKDNSVAWAPQAYTQGDDWYGAWRTVGNGAYVAFHVRMDVVGDTKVIYKCYVYPTIQSYMYDSPIIYVTQQPVSLISGFRVGKSLVDGFYFKFFQFGVESNQEITSTPWRVTNKKPCYFANSNWRYCPGYTVLGEVAYITYGSDWKMRVGGETYHGVSPTFVSTDFVEWGYTGTTVADDVQIWSGSGIVSDVVSKPYSSVW